MELAVSTLAYLIVVNHIVKCSYVPFHWWVRKAAFTCLKNWLIITTPTQIMNLLYNCCLSTCQQYAIYTLFMPNRFQHELQTQIVSDWLVRQLAGIS